MGDKPGAARPGPVGSGSTEAVGHPDCGALVPVRASMRSPSSAGCSSFRRPGATGSVRR